MQNPELNLRIEMFGNLVLELGKWNDACNDEAGLTELEYCEQMFIDCLAAVRDMRETLLEDLNEYKINCRTTETPIDISYHRIHVQLKESTFSLTGGNFGS